MTTRINTTIVLGSSALALAIGGLSPLAAAEEGIYSHLRAHARAEVAGSISSSVTGEYLEIADQFEVDSLNDPAAYAAFEQDETRDFDDNVLLSDGSLIDANTTVRLDERPSGFWIIGDSWGQLDLREGASCMMAVETHVEVSFRLHQPVIVDLKLRAYTARDTQAEGPATDVWIKDLETEQYAARNLNVDHDNFEDSYSDRVVLEHQIVLHPGDYSFGLTTSLGSLESDSEIYEAIWANSNSYIYMDPWTLGDANLDGEVNGADITVIFSNWGTAEPTCDFNNDGVVDGFDLTVLLSNWD